MGTRRSRHNKGRKVEGQHDLLQVNCALCFAHVFVPSRKHKRKGHVICERCANGVQSPHIIDGIARAPLDAGKGDFLKCDEAQALDISHVLMMTDDEAASTFERIRFSENGGSPDCPRCGSALLYFLATRRRWKCKSKSCEHEFTATSGTIFAARKLPVRFYLSAIALMLNGPKGLSISQIGRALGCGYKTIYRLAVQLREEFSGGKPDQSLIPPDEISDPKPRFLGGIWANSHTTWTAADQANLIALCKNETNIEKSADALGRTPKNLHSRARDLNLQIPSAWAALFRQANKRLRVGEPRVLLAYPFITRPRPEHADLLAVNALVPAGFPQEMRADICQEIMVALFEGTVTLDEIKSKRYKLQWFVRKFYRENMEDSGRAVSLTGMNPDDDREYYDIASAISQKDWDWEQLNDVRNAHDALSTHTSAIQFSDTYTQELHAIRKRYDEQGEYLNFAEVEERIEQPGFISPVIRAREAVFDDARKLATLLAERGLTGAGISPPTHRTSYVRIPGVRIRISDHPSGDSRLSGVEEFQWRSDLRVGYHFKKASYYSLEALVDDLLNLRAVKPLQHATSGVGAAYAP